MIAKIKLAAYVILSILVICFAHGFYSNYSKVKAIDIDQSGDTISQPAPVQSTLAAQTTNNLNLTNDLAGSNTVTGTNTPVGTNEIADSNVVTQSAQSNYVAAPTNTSTPSHPASVASPKSSPGNTVGYLVAFVLTTIGLGLLAAYDITQFVGSRAVDVLFDDDGTAARDPEYERAEASWSNGNHLEAIEMMREYLKKNPREQHVALRIAEIYEKDLHNYVAAALEYEEVLKKRLKPERWGWAAIHLCNIYAKLGRQDKMKELLERIATDYPKTGAAKKARRNLGLPEPEEESIPTEPTDAPESTDSQNEGDVAVFDLDEAIASTEGEAAPLPPAAKTEAPPPTDPAKPKLPPGFRPKG